MKRYHLKKERMQLSLGCLEKVLNNLTRSDEDLVDILVDLGKKNSILNIDINEVLNVSN